MLAIPTLMDNSPSYDNVESVLASSSSTLNGKLALLEGGDGGDVGGANTTTWKA